MRRFKIVQDLAADVDQHWRVYLDDEFDRKLYLEGFRYPSYQLVEHRETDTHAYRTIRVTPRLDLPGPVEKLLGKSFAFTEEGSFDKQAKVWRLRLLPSVLADRLSSEAVVRAEAVGEGKCRRTCELSVEARVFGIGGIVESALEKNLRTGWEESMRFMNAWFRRGG